VYLPLLRTIALYGKGNWVEEICEKNYDIINDGNYVGAPAMELAIYMFNHRLEVEYLKQKLTGEFDLNAWLDYIARFQMDTFSDKDKQDIYDAVTLPMPNPETIQRTFERDKSHALRMLGVRFSIYLYEEKQISFVTSGAIWGLMMDYWFDKNKKGNLMIDYASFDKHLSGLVGFFKQYMNNCIAAGIGAFYVYDFLQKIGLINELAHTNAIAALNKISGHIQNFGDQLWKNGFIKNWQKPDGMSDSLYLALMEGIEKGYTTSYEYPYRNYQEEAEITNRELDKAIMAKAAKMNFAEEPNYVPVRTEPKIGRNDPCTCGSGKKYKKCCGK
jgi:SEC-C motif